MADIKELQITAQYQQEVSPVILAQWCRELIEYSGQTVAKAAERVNMSRTAMQDLLSIDQLYRHLCERFEKKAIKRETLEKVAGLNKRKLVLLGRNLRGLDEELLNAALEGTTRDFEAVLESRKIRSVRVENSISRMITGIGKVAGKERGRLEEANEFELLKFGHTLGETLRQGIEGLNISKEMMGELLNALASECRKSVDEEESSGDKASQREEDAQPTFPKNDTEKTVEKRIGESVEERKKVSNIYNNNLLTDNYRDGDGAPDKEDRDAFLKQPSRTLSTLETSVCDEINRRLGAFGNNITPSSLGRFLHSGLTLDAVIEEFNYLIHRPGSSPGAVLYNQLLKRVLGRWRQPSTGFINRKYFKKGAPGDEARLLLKPLNLRELEREEAFSQCQSEGVPDWPELKEKMRVALPEKDRGLLNDVLPMKEDADSIFLRGKRPIVCDVLLEDYGDTLEGITGKKLIFI